MIGENGLEPQLQHFVNGRLVESKQKNASRKPDCVGRKAELAGLDYH